MSEIKKLEALEILDSRGNPTLAVTAILSSGVKATAKIPSGASTGKREAVELRDGDKKRYSGKGVLKACAHVEGEIQKAVAGMSAEDQTELDEMLRELDGTPTKLVWELTQFSGFPFRLPAPPQRTLICRYTHISRRANLPSFRRQC